MNIIDKIMSFLSIKKKFKVRVKHYAEDKYEVQFAHYFFVPIYYSLCYWFEQSVTSNTYCWSPRLSRYQEAENIAKRLKSIEDVRKWYEPKEAKEKDFYKRRKEHYAKNVPYYTKSF